MNGKDVSESKLVTKDDKGYYTIDLKKGETAIFTSSKLEQTDLNINATPVKEENLNLFGFSKKTERLPGHQFYSNKNK